MAKPSLHTKYLILSHHPRQSRIGGCASIYNVFFSKEREYDNVDYLNVKDRTSQDFIKDLIEKTTDSTVLLFNGCYSLCCRHSILALQYAHENNINVIIYWHETSWHLSKALAPLTNIKDLISDQLIHHWVASSQCKQLLMFFLEIRYEDVTVVYEAIPIAENTVCRGVSLEPSVIRICGAGLDSDIRKGLDFFIDISTALTSIDHISCLYDWYSRDSETSLSYRFKGLETVNFPGFSADFRNTLKGYDIFLLTSRDDPFPVAALESLANDIPVFCFDAVGMVEILPREFVAGTTGEMIQKIRRFWNEREKYAPGFFSTIVREFSTKQFVRRISRNGNTKKLPRYFDMDVPRWRFTFSGPTPPKGKILLFATMPFQYVGDIIRTEIKGQLSAVFAREDFVFDDVEPYEFKVVHYPKGAITPRLLSQNTIKNSIDQIDANIFLVLFFDDYGRGYEDVIEFVQHFGINKVWARTVSGGYYSLSTIDC